MRHYILSGFVHILVIESTLERLLTSSSTEPSKPLGKKFLEKILRRRWMAAAPISTGHASRWDQIWLIEWSRIDQHSSHLATAERSRWAAGPARRSLCLLHSATSDLQCAAASAPVTACPFPLPVTVPTSVRDQGNAPPTEPRLLFPLASQSSSLALLISPRSKTTTEVPAPPPPLSKSDSGDLNCLRAALSAAEALNASLASLHPAQWNQQPSKLRNGAISPSSADFTSGTFSDLPIHP